MYIYFDMNVYTRMFDDQSQLRIGYSGFLRFIRQIESSGDDYMRLQDNLYKDVSLGELFENASKAWNKK